MKIFLLLDLSFTLLSPFFPQNVRAQVYPTGFSQVQVANGLTNPTFISFSPDGRIFVSEQGGSLRIIKNGSLLPTPFLTLTVNSSGERGLLGVAFDPDFNSNHFLYVYYTATTPVIHNRISRFTANGDLVVAGSEVPVLDLDPLVATNHNGGGMAFGPDGKLYVGVGENANGANAQNLDTYLGKILRINSDGSVPAGNPFTTGSSQRQRIWAYGLRNPFTLSFDPLTGKLYVNDVGQSTWEEINEATTGGNNYGWPAAEGTSGNPAFTNPIHSYMHTGGAETGCAITGGTFFNPGTTNYPASYMGNYFYIDLCSNWMYMLSFPGGIATASNFATGIAGSPVSLVTGIDGNLYFISRNDNAVYEIIFNSPLPIELLRFKAELNSSHRVDLSWETDHEINTAYFVVEKSSGDNHFLSIDTVQAVNNPAMTNTYHSTDNPAGEGNCFYRLKMVDLDEHFKYSSVVMVSLKHAKNPVVYPNPAGAFINILQGTESIKFVSVYNISGKAMIRFNNERSENILHLSTRNLPKGAYQVEITTPGNVYVEKLLIE
jgi:glucose/arabinose dehydrogenase